MYHLELRQSFHNLNRFNLEEQDMLALALPWAQERPIEVGERKWSPHQAKLRILEGPHLEVNELALGRGWRAALRQSEDVTEAVIARIRAEVGTQRPQPPPPPPEPTARLSLTGPAKPRPPRVPFNPPPAPAPAPTPAVSAAAAGETPGAPGPEAGLPADPLALGVQLAALLGAEATHLLAAWREIATRAPGLSPSESLALAEREISSSGPAST
jgi:hypothetical protein